MKLIRKIINRLSYLHQIDKHKYIYYNFLCKRIIKGKGCKIVPYKGTRIQIAKTARIVMHSGTLHLNSNKIKGSKAECLVLLRENAVWEINGVVSLYYGAGVQVHNDAKLVMQSAYMNTGSLIICGYKITAGQELSMARMAFILDDDHHPIYNAENVRINEPKEIVIGDNVWLGMKSTVLKGAEIGNQCVIGANCLVASNIPDHMMVGTAPARPAMKDIHWER